MSVLTRPGRRKRLSGNVAMVIALVLVAMVVLAVVGAAGFYFWKTRMAGSGGSMTATAAAKAPANTQVLVAFDLERAGMSLTQQEQILGTLLKSKEFKAINQQLQAELGMTLEEDFLTWVTTSGAIMLAPGAGLPSLASGLDQADSQVPPFRALAVMRVRDEAKAQASLDKVQAKASAENGITYTTEDFQGATLHLPSKPGEGPAWTLHQGHLYLGFAADDLKMGLTAPAAGQSLADQAAYKQALGRVKQTDGMLIYADLQGILKGLPLEQMGAPDAAKMLSALRYAIMGSGRSGQEVLTEWFVVLDPAAAGPLASKVFSADHNLKFHSSEVHPQESEVWMAVNLRMLWDVAYVVMGAFPEGRENRDAPAQALKQQGVDFDADLLGALTGELSFSARNMGSMQAAQFESLSTGVPQEPEAAMEAMRKVPLVIGLGLTSRQALDRLLGKVPQLAMMLSTLKTTEVAGGQILSMPDNPQVPFALGMTATELLIGVNQPTPSLEAALKASQSKKTVGSLPGHARVLGMLGQDGKAIAVGFQDVGRTYAEAASQLKSAGRVSPEFVQALEQLAGLYGINWSAAAIGPEGLRGVSFMTLGK